VVPITVFASRRTPAFITEQVSPFARRGDEIDLLDAWRTGWSGDHHFVAYAASGGYRAAKATLGAPEGLRPVLTCLVADVDFPGHVRAWDDPEMVEQAVGWIEAAMDAVPGVGVYSTLGGFRLVGVLPEPVPADRADHLIQVWLDRLEAAGVPVDRACKDWTRLFRLPRVVREGAATEPPQGVDLPPTGPISMDWAPVVLESRVKTLTQVVTDYGPRPEVELLEAEPVPQGQRRQWTLAEAGRYAAVERTADPVRIYHAVVHRKAASVYDDEHLDDILDSTWQVCCWVAAAHADTVREEQHVAEVRAAFLEGLQARADDAFGVPWDDLRRRFVLAMPGAKQYVVYDPGTGRYTNFQVPKEHLFSLLERMIERANDPQAAAEQLELWRSTDNGPRKYQPIDLFNLYGRYVSEVTYEYGHDGGDFRGDGLSGELVRGCCQVQEVEPEFHAGIDEWLRAFAGGLYENLERWLVTVTRLDQPTCGLYLPGAPGTGKSLFAHCVAGMFGSRPTAWDRIVTSRFNGQLLECPVVFADEPKKGLGKEGSTRYRQLIGGGGIEIERKGQAVARLMGCPRVIIAANNEQAMAFQDSLSKADIDALIERTGIVPVQAEARDVLERHLEDVKTWYGATFNAHVAYLRETVAVEVTGRWLVSGWDTPLLRNLSANTDVAHELLSIIANLLDDDAMPMTGGKGLVLIGPDHKSGVDEGIYLSPGALKGLWTTYSTTPITQRQLNEATKTNAVGNEPVPVKMIPGRGRPKQLWRLDLSKLAAVAVPSVCGSEAELRALVRDRATPKQTKGLKDIIPVPEP